MFDLHPIIVHFAIALLSLNVLFDFLYGVSLKDKYKDFGNFTSILGTLSAIGAVLSGLQARQMLDNPSEYQHLINQHQLSGEITMWLFIGLFILRFIFIKRNWIRARIKWVYLIIALIALSFLFRTGLLGGEMVYIHGLGTGKGKTVSPETKPVKPQFYFEADTTQK